MIDGDMNSDSQQNYDMNNQTINDNQSNEMNKSKSDKLVINKKNKISSKKDSGRCKDCRKNCWLYFLDDRSELSFKRKFQNPDVSTCWLNACLHLVLVDLDYDETFNDRLITSYLGRVLWKLQSANNHSINHFVVKELLVDAEDARIATKLSEMSFRIVDEKVNEMYIKPPVSPYTTSLQDHVENYLNEATLIKLSCGWCKRESEKKQQVEIDDCLISDYYFE